MQTKLGERERGKEKQDSPEFQSIDGNLTRGQRGEEPITSQQADDRDDLQLPDSDLSSGCREGKEKSRRGRKDKSRELACISRVEEREGKERIMEGSRSVSGFGFCCTGTE